MQRLVIEVAADDADAASALLFEAGAEGIEQQDLPSQCRLIVYGDEGLLGAVEETLDRALARGLRSQRKREPVDDSWQKRWIEAASTHQLCDDIVMVPSGEPRPESAHVVLYFEPGWAFGTGGHATTRLAAEHLAEVLRSRAGARVLDVGTGSGTLALASLSWGASTALGLDTDPRAIPVAERNAELNGFAERAHFAETPIERITDAFDVVVANIDLPTLLRLATDLARVTHPRGELLVTGLLTEYANELVQAFSAQSCELVAEADSEGWSLLRLRHALGKTRQS